MVECLYQQSRCCPDVLLSDLPQGICNLNEQIRTRGFAVVAVSSPAVPIVVASQSDAVASAPGTRSRSILEIHDCRNKGSRTVERMLSFVSNFLSEPYSTYSIRYFVQQFPHLSYLAFERSTGTPPPTPGQMIESLDGRSLEIFPPGSPSIQDSSTDGDLVGILVAREELLNPSLDTGAAEVRCCGRIASTPLIGWPRLLEPFEPEHGGFSSKLQAGYLGMVAVSRHKRRHGIATLLVNLVLHQFTLEGHLEVALETEATNLPALAFYERLGFVSVGRHPRYYAGGVDAVTMVKPLQVGSIQRLPFWTCPPLFLSNRTDKKVCPLARSTEPKCDNTNVRRYNNNNNDEQRG